MNDLTSRLKTNLPTPIEADIERFITAYAPTLTATPISLHANADEIGIALREEDTYSARLPLPLHLPQLAETLCELALRPVETTIMLAHKWEFSARNRLVTNASERIELTDKEAALLEILLLNAPTIVTPEQLLKRIWGYDRTIDTHTLQTHIYRLRQKLEPLQAANTASGIKTADEGYYWQN